MATALNAAEVKLLTEIGFIALWSGLVREAEVIFNGIQAARPHGEAGTIGMAMVHLAESRVEEAIALLRSQRRSVAARVYLGLALSKQGNVRLARKTLQGVVERAPDTPFAELARAGLQELPA